MASSDNRVVDLARQSKPVDVTAPYDKNGVKGKTILITGGASGFGAAFAREWAKHGAYIMVGDINDEAGEKFVAELREMSGSEHHHYHHCDVSDWQSQVNFFKAAVSFSPTGAIDAVVPNAGIGDPFAPQSGIGFENPHGLDGEDPPAPWLKVMDINLTGVMYTIHLALFWLPKNGAASKETERGNGSLPQPRSDGSIPDRHILLIGSVASMIPLVGQVQYTASKHAVMGIFRSLRGSSYQHGVRVNMLCPYFVDTPIMPPGSLLMLAGSGLGRIEDVVDAGTRFMADASIRGRALVVGPRVTVDETDEGEYRIVDVPERGEWHGQALWECYAHDFNNVEMFVYKYTKLLNNIVRFRGWSGWWSDISYRLWGKKGEQQKIENEDKTT
jgi:NAD(P)-dependent dehydrogenase (short-subunit alcohol dehydrogenase family)